MSEEGKKTIALENRLVVFPVQVIALSKEHSKQPLQKSTLLVR